MKEITDQDFFDAALTVLLEAGAESQPDDNGMPGENYQQAVSKMRGLMKEGNYSAKNVSKGTGKPSVKPSPFASRRLAKMLNIR